MNDNELIEIDKQLNELPDKIEKQTDKVIQEYENYRKKKMEYELKYSKTIQTEKVKNKDLTQIDLQAIAEIESEIERLEMILAQSKHKREYKQLQFLRDSLDAIKERSYNWRAHIKSFK